MKADPQAQRRLLELQAIDTALGQLAHRRRTLPELPELEKLGRELSTLDDERVRAQVAADDLDRDIARLEKDIDQVRARADRDRARLDAGTGPARELEALQHELGTLSRRQTELEDAELELMERREEAQAVIDRLDARGRTTREQQAQRSSAGTRTSPELPARRSSRRSARSPLVVDLHRGSGRAVREDPGDHRHGRRAAAEGSMRGMPVGAVRLRAVPGAGRSTRRGDPVRGMSTDPRTD